MSSQAPAAPLGVDPLIAEAKQRARRRRFALLLLVLAGGAGAYFSLSGGGGGSGKTTSGVANISVPRVAAAGFIAQPSAAALAADSLVAMSFPTARVGYLVTGDGRLLRSSDEGITWRRVGFLGPIKRTWQPPRLDFVTSRIGYALTPTSRLLATVDGGTRWHLVSRLPASSRLDFVDPNDGWAATPSGAIYRTADGGRSWTRLAAPRCYALAGLSFFTRVSGFAVCSGQGGAGQAGKDLYETRDGGNTWLHIAATHFTGSGGGNGLPDIPASGYADGLLFRSPRIGVMSADRAGLYLTRDGARTWSLPLLTDDAWSVSAMSWPSARVVYALIIGGNGDALLRSTDGARRWQRIYPVGPGAPGSTVAALSRQVLVGAGTGTFGERSGTIVRTTNSARTWTTPGPLPGHVQQVVRGTGGLWALTMARTGTSSPHELIFRSGDAGATWRRVRTPQQVGLAPWLDATPFGSVYLSTLSGALYRSDDGGGSWRTIRLRGRQLGALEFATREHGFAVVESSWDQWNLLQTTDGGKTWRPAPTTGGLSPRDFYALDSEHWWLWGFTVSGCHVIARTKRPGFPGKRVCAGGGAFLLRTVDGGMHWTAVRMPSVLSSPSYSFLTPRLGYATSEDGILRTTDAGRTWRWLPSDRLPIRR